MKQGTKLGISLIVAASLAMAGCSSLETKKIDYKSAGKIPPLDVPPDIGDLKAEDRYAVPDVAPRGVATLSTYTDGRPAQAGQGSLLPTMPNVSVERAGSQRWLVVKATPEQVWPEIREFWQELGFLIKTETPEAGIMETDWAEDRAKIPQGWLRSALGAVIESLYSTAERDKFRTRLEPGKEAGTTEVYISHRGMYEVLEGGDGGQRTIWQPRPSDPELEAEMLRRLMVRFGVEATQAKTVVAKPVETERAKLARSAEGETTLTVNDAFDRAWRRVGLALDRVGFTVVDRDRNQGVYYVRYVKEDDGKGEGGFFAKLFSGDDKTGKPEQFRILLSEIQGGTLVRVQDKTGAAEKSDTSSKILNLLHAQLK